MALLLVELGSDLLCQDRKGLTPIDLAHKHGYFSLVDQLRAVGSSNNSDPERSVRLKGNTYETEDQ